jgi:signal transduction histidine kinase
MQAINDCGIFRYLTKPWNEREMNLTLNQALDTYNLRRENSQLIKKLTEANATLEEKVKERTQKVEGLISTVAHDLRSPLNQILAIISLIQLESNLTPTQINSIEMVVLAATRLKEMINRMLDLNAIEHRDINLKLQSANLDSIVQDVANQVRALCVKKNLNLTVQPMNGSQDVCVDVNYLIQVLENLLSNAIKFSPRNKNIFIESDTSGTMARLVVRDEGPGLTDEDMKLLFNKYQQLSARPSSGEESSGLGLYLSKKYVENMNGKIWCESQAGKGASFIIELQKPAN